jgi:hypothetical protein
MGRKCLIPGNQQTNFYLSRVTFAVCASHGASETGPECTQRPTETSLGEDSGHGGEGVGAVGTSDDVR